MKPSRILTAILLCLVLAPAQAGTREVPVDAAIDAELGYLLGLVGSGSRNAASFRAERLDKTLQFLLGPKDAGTLLYAKDRNGAPSAYLQLDLRRPMADVLRLTYDTALPAVVTSPSTVRTARWNRIDSSDGRLPPFWEHRTDAPETLIATGIEHLINSPDAHTGAYYEYDLDRTLILTRWRDRPLFISLSAQKGRSEVGKQGLILGDDSRWTYLYSGIPGLVWPGFGWVDSYLYDSYSVVFYLGTATGDAPTRFGIFKWIRAGWVGMNMAQRAHIHAGLRRYADAFKLILESPRTGDVTSIIRRFSAIREMPADQLAAVTARYLAALRTELNAAPKADGADRALEWLGNGRYLETIGTEERISIASLEQLKALLGKPHHVTLNPAPERLPHRR